MVITGTKSTAQAVAAARKFARVVQLVGHTVKFQNFAVRLCFVRLYANYQLVQIRNLVATGDCNHEVRLGLFLAKNEGAVYEPELFPGLIYRLKTPKAVVLIFQNGKVVSGVCFAAYLTSSRILQVVTGAKSEEEAQAVYSHIVRMIDDIHAMPMSAATMLSAIRREI